MVSLEGLEPSTCRLWVWWSRRIDGWNLRNFKGFFHANFPCVWHPRLSRNLPMIHQRNWTRAYGFELPESQPWQGIMADRTMARTRTGSEIGIQELQLGRCRPDSPRLSPPGVAKVLHSQAEIFPEAGILADSRWFWGGTVGLLGEGGFDECRVMVVEQTFELLSWIGIHDP